MEIVRKYFPGLTEKQLGQLGALAGLYEEWNSRINVISRRDIGNLYEHHVLHSLAIAKAFPFQTGTEVLDIGTGGGFPGIPLAILYPDCRFKLIDGTGKKILVVKEVAKAIGLDNVRAEHIRGEQEREMFHFVVSRAAMPLEELVRIGRKNILPKQHNAMLNGVICLKGGNTDAEVHEFRRRAEIQAISQWFEEEWFREKSVIYVPM